MANEPIRPSTPDGTAAQSRPRATTPAAGSLGRVAAFDAGALFTAFVAGVALLALGG
ncbi:hypothetical protein [Halorubrum sp. SD683]|uniref:hypothetical protein n=1 Tax=Halorubrum sp. SD683 TaxID=1855873 RepID=UPI001302C86C|nr:hypothetical protein [Halorubrum sp. SD683]